MAPQGILPNMTTRLIQFFSSDPIMPNKTHPDPVNKLWILRNMVSTHKKTNYKVSPRFKNQISKN